jgi:D-serine deaminase-like pyridoxal phosphate-dependent protein
MSDCALTILSSVISVNSDRVVIDAGATALSKDSGPTHIEPNVGFGKMFKNYQENLVDNEVILKSLSQEHGKILPVEESELGYRHGEKLRIVPNHSCLTANLYDNYHVVKGETVVNRWKVHRGRYE